MLGGITISASSEHEQNERSMNIFSCLNVKQPPGADKGETGQKRKRDSNDDTSEDSDDVDDIEIDRDAALLIPIMLHILNAFPNDISFKICPTASSGNTFVPFSRTP